ncbi:MAG: hypothetical protein R3F61_27335 [Myxococcota bacterium]
MDDLDEKTLAGFRILVAIAKADGRISPEELDALHDSFGPHKALVERLIAEDVDVDRQIALLGDEETRARVYRSGFALAHVDDHMAHDEVNILERVWPEHEEDSLVEEVLEEVKDTLLPSNIMPIADPARRQDEIEHDTLKYSIISAIVGATPIPGVAIIADAAVIAIQVKLVRDIGQYWGHTIDGPAAKSLLGTAAGGLGVRVAVNNLMRFVPGWGSAFSAATSFASTYAIARVANAYFAGDKALDDNAMRDLFKKAKAEGEGVYSQRKHEVDALKDRHGDQLKDLGHQVGGKAMSAADYERAVLDTFDVDGEPR